jgi:pathogenicity locus Cdd1 protein
MDASLSAARQQRDRAGRWCFITPARVQVNQSSDTSLLLRIAKESETDYSLPMSMANIKRIRKDRRDRRELISIGPAMLRDFKLLGVNSVAELARQNPEKLYAKLCRMTAQQQDVCVLDAFRAGVAQARNPRLPAEQCQWWYWSRRRKQ